MASMGHESRRSPRVPYALQIPIRGPKGITSGRCQNLGLEDLMLYTSKPYKEGTAVRLKFMLPGQDQAILTDARVQRCLVREKNGSFCWMWLTYANMSAQARERILRFLLESKVASTTLRTPTIDDWGDGIRGAGAGKPAMSPANGTEQDEPSCSIEEFTGFAVKFRDTGDFTGEYADNISRGGIFIRTDKVLPKDAPVVISLYIPGSARPMYLEGKVVWWRASDPPGLGIRFVDPPLTITRRIDAFVKKVTEMSADL